MLSVMRRRVSHLSLCLCVVRSVAAGHVDDVQVAARDTPPPPLIQPGVVWVLPPGIANSRWLRAVMGRTGRFRPTLQTTAVPTAKTVFCLLPVTHILWLNGTS